MRRKFLVFAITLIAFGTAQADSLECKNDSEQQTDIGFYNHWGKIVFQLSVPYEDRYLYILGNCYSDGEIGIPYTCEPAATDDSNKVAVRLINGAQGQPMAEITLRYPDGARSELIPCLQTNRLQKGL